MLPCPWPSAVPRPPPSSSREAAQSRPATAIHLDEHRQQQLQQQQQQQHQQLLALITDRPSDRRDVRGEPAEPGMMVEQTGQSLDRVGSSQLPLATDTAAARDPTDDQDLPTMPEQNRSDARAEQVYAHFRARLSMIALQHIFADFSFGMGDSDLDLIVMFNWSHDHSMLNKMEDGAGKPRLGERAVPLESNAAEAIAQSVRPPHDEYTFADISPDLDLAISLFPLFDQGMEKKSTDNTDSTAETLQTRNNSLSALPTLELDAAKTLDETPAPMHWAHQVKFENVKIWNADSTEEDEDTLSALLEFLVDTDKSEETRNEVSRVGTRAMSISPVLQSERKPKLSGKGKRNGSKAKGRGAKVAEAIANMGTDASDTFDWTTGHAYSMVSGEPISRQRVNLAPLASKADGAVKNDVSEVMFGETTPTPSTAPPSASSSPATDQGSPISAPVSAPVQMTEDTPAPAAPLELGDDFFSKYLAVASLDAAEAPSAKSADLPRAPWNGRPQPVAGNFFFDVTKPGSATLLWSAGRESLFDPAAEPSLSLYRADAEEREYVLAKLDTCAAMASGGLLLDARAGIEYLQRTQRGATQDSQLAALVSMYAGLVEMNACQYLAAADHFAVQLQHHRLLGDEAGQHRAAVLQATALVGEAKVACALPYPTRLAHRQRELDAPSPSPRLPVYAELPAGSIHALRCAAAEQTAERTICWALSSHPPALTHLLEANLLLASLAELQNQPTAALARFQDAYEMALLLDDKTVQLRCLSAAAELEADRPQSVALLRQALALADEIAAGLPLEQHRMAMDDAKIALVHRLQQELIAEGNWEAAFVMADARRARHLRAHLGVDALPDLEDMRMLAVARQASIVSYSVLPGSLCAVVACPDGKVHFRKIDTSGIDLNFLVEQARSDICAQLEVSKQCRRLRQAESSGSSGAPLRLCPKKAASPSPAAAPAAATSAATVLPPTNLARQAKSDAMAGKHGLPIPPPPPPHDQCDCQAEPPLSMESQLLSALLIGAIRELLPACPAPVPAKGDAPHIVFVGSDVLHLVSYAALRDVPHRHVTPAEFAAAPYLIDSFAISVAPSVALLCHWTRNPPVNRRLPGTPPKMAAIGVEHFDDAKRPSLRHAQLETISVARLYNIDPVEADKVTPQGLLDHVFPASKGMETLHIATHAFLEPVSMAHGPYDNKGALILHSDQLLDQLPLTPSHMRWELPSVVIGEQDLSHIGICVLSACHTAEGQIIDSECTTVPSEGPLSLTRAFHRAGVTATVGSLWAVNDTSTTLQMIEFHRQIARGRSYAQALRTAMLAVRDSNPRLGLPYYWAAFTVSGRI